MSPAMLGPSAGLSSQNVPPPLMTGPVDLGPTGCGSGPSAPPPTVTPGTGAPADGTKALSQAYETSTGLPLSTPPGLPPAVAGAIPAPGGWCYTMAGNAMGVKGVMTAAALQAAARANSYTTIKVTRDQPHPPASAIPGATWHTDSHSGVVSGGTSYDFTQAATREHQIPATVHERSLNDVRNAVSLGSGRQPYKDQDMYIHIPPGQPVPSGYEVGPMVPSK